MEPLTTRQADVLAFVAAYHATHGTAPTLDEIRQGLGIGSVTTVHKHLENLRAKGYVARRHHHARATDVLVSRNATSEVLSAFAAGWEACVEAEASDRASAMLAARASWLEGRS
jgi:SOS-response transcriptional repressor LexA